MKTSKQIIKLLLPMMLFATISCGGSSSSSIPASSITTSEETLDKDGIFTDEDFLMVDGNVVRNNHSLGETVTLRGTNAGGYLVLEQWMCAVGGSEYYDHKLITETFVNRFGKEKTVELWEYYRENFWTDYDFLNCYEMGMNVIRLPFSYMNVDPEYNNVRAIPGQKYNFEILDKFVADAASYGIYTILDLHGAYGSQNGQDHSGESQWPEEVDFYSNEEKMSKTVDLWGALAEHFKGNPAVAAYDILNEPGERLIEHTQSTTTRHWEFFDRVYEEIRKVDEDHIVIFESCWDGANLPQPSEYGWTNCMYSFHNYSGDSDADRNLLSMQNKINGVLAQNFNIPFYMGEFNCYGNERSWELTLSLFNREGWHWTSWTYKLNRTHDLAYPGWGIYYSYAERVDPLVDDIETIKEKWYKIDTAHEDVQLMRFDSTNTLKNVMKAYCGGKI